MPMFTARRARITSAAAFGLALVALWAVTPAARAAGDVEVLYAGSLVNLMERSVGPAFDRATGDHFRGYAAGSKLLAHQIKGRLRRADVFISAAPAVNRTLMGEANGAWVQWYVTFADSPLVLGYNPKSRYAAQLESGRWYRALMQPGIRIGRTDPRLDPKGARTLALMRAAAAFYHMPGLAQRVLGAAENPAQVLPEQTLIGRLQSGQLDVGFFYSTETTEAGIPTVRLPAGITPRARYTLAIVRGAPDPRAAQQFAAFLLGPAGRALMGRNGLKLQRPVLSGDVPALPAPLRWLLGSRR